MKKLQKKQKKSAKRNKLFSQGSIKSKKSLLLPFLIHREKKAANSVKKS